MYVGGTSYGGTVFGFDFCDHGTAVVFHVSMAVREDLSAENRVIAMTGIIARVADPNI